ncbi:MULTISPECIES: hypothetical protein [Flavobacterium]|uniref:hypothetical protein n=1 Tax=Flavobacterium TaxID=237 RepID=UPI001FCC0B5D|nr:MULTISPECIES: hypothetical protein [Flavobacterium]UOK43055.1 hypothetical protein LZF87_02785 [Flavobacterium enshiense]
MKKVALLMISFLLINCDKQSEDSTQQEKSGVLIDSPVINIGYRTQTYEGRTDAEGKYRFKEGETVTFFICDLVFPAVPATGYVTPFDMAGSTDITNSTVINISRFLQSIDADGNPENGISVPEVLHNCGNDIVSPVNFHSTVSGFENDSAVIHTIENSTSPTTELLPTDQCITHLINNVYATAKYFEVYGKHKGDFGFNTNGTLLGTSASAQKTISGGHIIFNFNVSGYERFVIYVPSTSQKIYVDAVLFDDEHWLNSTVGVEGMHRSQNFNPANTSCNWADSGTQCPYNSGGYPFDGYVENGPDNITITNDLGETAFYNYSTRKMQYPTPIEDSPLAANMKIYIKM